MSLVLYGRRTAAARAAAVVLTGCAFLLAGARDTAAAEAKKPSWVDKGAHPAYPQEMYMTGLGIGQVTGDKEGDWKRAEDTARAKIIEQIRIQVAQIVKSEETEHIQGKESSTTALTEIVTKTATSLTLEGVRIAARWEDRDDSALYALAVLDRDQAAGLLRSKILDNRKDAASLRGTAQREQAGGNPYMAGVHFIQAHARLSEAYSDLAVLRIVNEPVAAKVEKESPVTSPAELGAFIDTMVEKFRITAAGGMDQKTDPGSGLADPLRVSVEYEDAGTRHPVRGMPVRMAFEGGKGRLDAALRTDAAGIAVCRVYAVEPTGEETNAISAVLAPDFSDPWRERVSRKKVIFTYILPTARTTRFLIQVRETNMGKPVAPSRLESALGEALSGGGYAVVDPAGFHSRLGRETIAGIPESVLREKARGLADILIIGDAKAVFSSTMSSGFHFAKARGVVRAIRLDTGKIIASVDREVKDASSTEERAGLRALGDLSQSLSEEFYTVLQAQLAALGLVPASAPKSGDSSGSRP